MIRQQTRIGLVLISILFMANAAWGQVFPKPVGFVNDFAHVLTADQAKNLESRLRSYRDSTGIELAVVTVSSLGDMPIEDYASKLFTQWGIGEKGKDNGVLMLLAPTERKVRIEVGYGLEPDLTDSTSGNIIQQYAIPNFKVNNWSAGTEATVNGIIDHLGSKSFQARAEARAEEKRRQEDERARVNAEIAVAFKYVSLVAFVLAVLFGSPIVFLYRKRRRNELKDLIKNSIDVSRESIATIRAKYPPAMARLESLAREIPPDEYRAVNDKLTALPQVVSDIEKDVNILATVQGYSLSALEGQLYAFGDIQRNLIQISPDSVINSIESKIRERRQAERKSRKLLESVPKKIAAVRERAIIGERQIAQAKGKLGEAENQSKMASPDWISIYALLVAVDNLLSQPSRLPSNYNSRRLNYSSRYSGSRSTGGSSFGGFGGGRSGGGGATGSF